MNRCIKCGALETEPARENCGNPIWHLPNFNAPATQPDTPEAEEGE